MYFQLRVVVKVGSEISHRQVRVYQRLNSRATFLNPARIWGLKRLDWVNLYFVYSKDLT